MANYVWTAKDQTGRTVAKENQADTSAEAKASLLAEGYTDLVLKEEEIMDAVRAGFPDKITVFGEEVRVTAEDRLGNQDNQIASFGDAFRQCIGPGNILWLVIIFFAIYWSPNRLMSVLLLLVAMLAWFAFIFLVSLPSVYYKKLIKASDWNRWKEVLSLVATLEKFGRFSFANVPATELIRNRAKALAGMGRLNEALQKFKQCEGRPDCPTWLHKLFVGSLYVTARQYDKAIESNFASIAEKPTPTAWADIAYRYARYVRDPVRARQAMAEADKSPTPDPVKPNRIRSLGIISYLEGDYPTAKTHLETTIDMVDKAKSRPFRDGHLSVARAYLCCVLAKQGDLPAAKKNFALAKEYLVATNEDALLAECGQLIGERT